MTPGMPPSSALLTALEEVELAKSIEAGLLAQERLESTTPADERMELRRVAAAGEQARERFLLANLRLVHFWARRRWASGHTGGLSYEDLHSEGVLGLIRAIQKFDYTQGFKFSTYASAWIRQFMGRAAAGNSAAHIPHHVREQAASLHSTSEDLRTQLRREPTLDELATAMGIPTRAVAELQQLMRPALSTETPVTWAGGLVLGDLLTDARDVSESTVQAELSDQVQFLLSGLTTREQRVLELRFGLAGHDPHTVEETARALDVLPAMVRDVLKAAIAKLRHVEGIDALHDFLVAA